MIAVISAVLILVTLVLASVSIRVVIDGLQRPSRSERFVVRLLAWVAGFILVCGMLGAVAYCGVALAGFMGWLA